MSLLNVMSFVGGAADRAREYDKADAKRTQRLAEIKAKRQDELLNTKWSDAKKKRDKDVEKYEGFMDKGGDITSQTAQAHLLGYKDVTAMQKDIVNIEKAGGEFTWAKAPVMPPELEAIKYTDEDAMYKSMLKTQGTTAGQIFEAMGGPKREVKEEVMTEDQVGSVPTYRRAAPSALTEEQKSTLSGYTFKEDADDKKLDVEKKKDYYFTMYSDPKLFPELINVTPDMKERIAFDVANKTIALNKEGLQVDIFKETLNSLNAYAEVKQGIPPGVEQGIPTDVDLSDTSIPQATRVAQKKERDDAKKAADELAVKLAEEERIAQKKERDDAKKAADKLKVTLDEEDRERIEWERQQQVKTATQEQKTGDAIEKSQPFKVTTTDIGLAGNVLESATMLVNGKPLPFHNELAEDSKNRIEADVAGNVNAIMSQRRISQTEAYDLATAIAKSGLTHEGDNVVTDMFTNEFSYQSPIIKWQDVYDTYNALKKSNPSLTYNTVVRAISNKNKKK